ncbi:MAG: hypothetical protein Q8K21_12055 [Hydrogenophaga sp.]|uniref:hypothetical protein n=1 Tax=Hydrogenophaga sp. TaxID=1904254 RepID=UPI00272EF190|nr:hypothetical protein [Hydrogenophaga sp.]MDP2164924.1 hypothetical protein [Hydrogenophaga sp.]
MTSKDISPSPQEAALSKAYAFLTGFMGSPQVGRPSSAQQLTIGAAAMAAKDPCDFYNPPSTD